MRSFQPVRVFWPWNLGSSNNASSIAMNSVSSVQELNPFAAQCYISAWKVADLPDLVICKGHTTQTSCDPEIKRKGPLEIARYIVHCFFEKIM